MLKVSIDRAAVTDILGRFEMSIYDAVRPAAQAGAQVFYDQVKVNVPVSKKGHWFHGTSFRLNKKKYWFDSGSLKNSIYQVFSKDNSNEKKAMYHIAWNHKKVPYGFMVEYGTSRTPASPFLNPAWSRRHDVYTAVNQKLKELIK